MDMDFYVPKDMEIHFDFGSKGLVQPEALTL